jgi:hypothetical protein
MTLQQFLADHHAYDNHVESGTWIICYNDVSCLMAPCPELPMSEYRIRPLNMSAGFTVYVSFNESPNPKTPSPNV